MEDPDDARTSPHGSFDDIETPPSTSDGVEMKDQRGPDLMETRTTSTTTLHRLDVSPAPSSVPTARRSDGSSKVEELRFRVLCPAGLVGSLIGRRGESIKRLRREANAELLIEDFVPGCQDRVMSITICRDARHHTWASGGDALVAVFDSLCEIGQECATVSGASDECEETTTASDADANMSCHVIPEDETYRLRLLVDASQVGFVVGKSGAAIRQTQEESGASVKVMPKAELPACAWVSDEVIHVSGPHHAVCQALRMLARQLEQHPPRPHHGCRRGPVILGQASTSDSQFVVPPIRSMLHGGLPLAAMSMAGGAVETVFRFLAPSSRVGQMLGRNGEHMRRVRTETGARVKLYGENSDADDRLVCIYSTEDASSQYCAAQDALVRCARCVAGEDGAQGGLPSMERIRLLAPQTAIGAVLGKKGYTVMQLRQETGASIRVHPVEAPLAAAAAAAYGGGEPGGDEIIQIDGSMQQCVAALRGIATLLRGWQIRRAFAMSPRPGVTGPVLLAHPQTLGLGPMHGTIGGLVAIPIAGPVGHHHAFTPLPSLAGGGAVLWRYRLSNAQAGAVIGKGGHHVTHIRNATGARVHLPADTAVADGLRTLEISGSMESCRAAHHLVNQYLVLGQCPLVMPEHQSGVTLDGVSIMPYGARSVPGSPHEAPHGLHQITDDMNISLTC